MTTPALNACGRITQIAFIVFNFLYLVIGLGLIGLGSYLVHSGNSFSFFTGNEFFSGAAILIICGIVIFLITGAGIAGALFRWKLLLYLYIVIVVIIVILEVAAAIVGFVLRHDIANRANETGENAIAKYYPESNDTFYDKSLNEAVDFVQETFKCCGWNYTEIWLTSPYYFLEMQYPDSCSCAEEPANSTVECMDAMGQLIYSTPCNDELSSRLRNTVIGIGVGGVVFGILQIIPILLSIGLVYAIHKAKNSYTTV